MESTSINKTATSNRDFRLIDGESRQLRSNYYQQLIKYTRSLIRTLNNRDVSSSLEDYCYKQLWLTHIEIERTRAKYQTYISPETPPNGPQAS